MRRVKARQVPRGHVADWIIYKHPKDGHYACVVVGSVAADRCKEKVIATLNGTEADAVGRCYELEAKEKAAGTA